MSALPDHIELAESGRQEATPLTRIWYVGWLLMGLSILISGLDSAWEPTFSLASFPDWVSLALGGGIFLGSVALLLGSTFVKRLDKSWRWEKLGATLAGVSWLGFFIATAWSQPSIFIPWIFGLTSFIALLFRLLELSRREKFMRVIYEAERRRKLNMDADKLEQTTYESEQHEKLTQTVFLQTGERSTNE